MSRWWCVASVLMLSGCAEWSLFAEGGRSIGVPNSGWLERGTPIAERGRGFVRARPGDGARFGHQRLVRAIEHAAADVEAKYPGGVPLRVGDIASEGGGAHERHASHRTGRDVDLAFFVTTLDGKSVTVGTVAFDRHGVARARSGELVRFDVARNWALVRSMLADDALAVQWIFCSSGVKSLLLRHAREVETDPEVLVRAMEVLHQPSNGRSHNDHFHVRIMCDAADSALGCLNMGPRWPWLRAALEPATTAPPGDDATLLDALRDEETASNE